MHKNYNIQFLRFVFCILIVSAHFFRRFLIKYDYLPWFSHAHMADEFFFIVSGYYCAKYFYVNATGSDYTTIDYIYNRIKKVAAIYYAVWVFIFFGRRMAKFLLGGDWAGNVINDLFNGVYELLFLQIFHFKNAYITSAGVMWYFSALLVVLLLICPMLSKHGMKYMLNIAPISSLFIYAFLSQQYDYLNGIYSSFYGLPVVKGFFRAFAAINLGVFLFGVVNFAIRKPSLDSNLHPIRATKESISVWLEWGLWLICVIYCISPLVYKGPVEVQGDYLIIFVLFLAFAVSFYNEEIQIKKLKGDWNTKNIIFEYLGKVSFYVFFTQDILYSFDRLLFLYLKDCSCIFIYIVYVSLAMLIAIAFYSADSVRKKYLHKEN